MSDLRSLWPRLKWEQKNALVSRALDFPDHDIDVDHVSLGMLLRCGAQAGITYGLSGSRRGTVASVRFNGGPLVVIEHSEPEEAVALAFCLASGVSLPEGWGEEG